MSIKACTACLRPLPLTMYNVTLRNADGYDERCKDCRNFYYKLAYRNKAPKSASVHQTPLVPVYPITKHNNAFLIEALRDGRRTEWTLNGTCLETKVPYTIIITRQKQMYRFEVWGPMAMTYEECYISPSKDDLLKFGPEFLRNKKIRLHTDKTCDIMI